MPRGISLSAFCFFRPFGFCLSIGRRPLPCLCPFRTSWRAGAKPSLGMLISPGKTALPSARDCFGGGYRHTPRNDVVGEWRCRRGTVVLAARDCFGGGCRHTPRNDVVREDVGARRFVGK